jgi:hypothetical protein
MAIPPCRAVSRGLRAVEFATLAKGGGLIKMGLKYNPVTKLDRAYVGLSNRSPLALSSPRP